MTERQTDLKPVKSLHHLRQLAADDMVAASNLGQPCENYAVSMQSLENIMAEVGDEADVTGEINFVLDLVT